MIEKALSSSRARPASPFAVAALSAVALIAAASGCGSTAPDIERSRVALRERPAPERLEIPTDPDLQAYRDVSGFPDYVIGPSDILRITMRDVSITQESVTVRPDGNISFSLVENIRAAGRTLTELDEALTAELSRYLRDPKVDVDVEEYKSKIASLLGAIRQLARQGVWTGQGRYPLKTRTSVLDLILEAGGTTADSQLERVQLIRGGYSYQLDLQRVLDFGDDSQNVILQGGDIVIVPGTELRSKKVVMLGEVSQPNVYMFSGDARLSEAISQAGGLSSNALSDDVRLIRVVDGEPRMYSLNFERLMHNGDVTQNVALQNDDIIYVPRSFMGDVNQALTKIQPLLSFLLLPATYRDLYSTGGGLRLDTGLPAGGAEAIYTRPLPGTGKPAATPADED